MNENKLSRIFPNASKAFIKANSDTHKDTRKTPELESDIGNAPLVKTKLQGATETALVRITSIRKNLLDTDNICQKFLVDILRYANILHDDNFEQTTIQTTQRKCRPEEDECTEIEIIIDIKTKPD